MILRKRNNSMMFGVLLFFLITITAVTAVVQAEEASLDTAVSPPPLTDPLNTLSCPSPLKVMPAGDSITYGIGSTGLGNDGTGGGYRKPLLTDLTNAGHNIDFVGKETDPQISGFDNDHEGYPGIAVAGLMNAIKFRLLNNPADVVLVHLGTNNINNNSDVNDIIDDLNTLLDSVDEYETHQNGAHATVILAQIINRSCEVNDSVCDGRYAQTQVLNSAIATLVQDRVNAGDDVRLVDMENDTNLDYSAGSADFDPDGLHPNNAGYAKIADVWFAALESFIDDACVFPPTILTTANTTAEAEQVYTYDVDASGTAPVTFSLPTKPTGMSINGSSGVISWTPTTNQLGLNNVTVQAANALGTDTQSFSIEVFDAPIFTSSSPAGTAVIDTQYTYQAATTAYPAATYSLTTKPTGMSINASTGLLTWTPGVDDVDKTFSVNIRATNSEGTANLPFTVEVGNELLLFLPMITK